MSGHFSRLVYDECFINEECKQSTKPGDYRLYDGQVDNKNSCHSVLGPRSNRVGNSAEVDKGANFADRAELESALSNRDIPASRCPKNKTLDDKKKAIAKDLSKSVYCDKFLNPTNSEIGRAHLNSSHITISYAVFCLKKKKKKKKNNHINKKTKTKTHIETIYTSENDRKS